MINLGLEAKNILKNKSNDIKSQNFYTKTLSILQVEITECKKKEIENSYINLPADLCLNLKNYLNNKNNSISDTYKIDFNEEEMKEELKNNYNKDLYLNIPYILAKYTYKFYTPPYTLYSNQLILEDNDNIKIDILTQFFEQIFEGIYINNNINSIMQFMLNKIGNTTDSLIPKQTKNIYEEKHIFSKDKLIIQKLFDYYNNDPNINKAIIDNYICFFLCANISNNDGIKTAVANNAKNYDNRIRQLQQKTPNQPLTLPPITKINYEKELMKTQISMFNDFKPIIDALGPQ